MKGEGVAIGMVVEARQGMLFEYCAVTVAGEGRIIHCGGKCGLAE